MTPALDNLVASATASGHSDVCQCSSVRQRLASSRRLTSLSRYCTGRSISRHQQPLRTYGRKVLNTHRAKCQSDTPQPHPGLSHAAVPSRKDNGTSRTTVVLLLAVAALFLYAPAHAIAKACCEGAAPGGFSITGAAKGLLDFILHLDKHLSAIIAKHGQATYAILFGIVFAETGLVLTPFLPGDSLLFAAGAFAALGSLNVWAVSGVFITAAILGDAVNYAVGNYLGAKAIERNFVQKEYIAKTEKFYRKHGGKTVVLARFVPIVRTFAPFVAGVGSMPYKEFGAYNVGGAVLWTVLFVGAGFFFGNLDFVRHNFTLVVLAIVAVSVLPIAFEVAAARREGQGEKGAEAPDQDPPTGQTSWRVAPPPA